MLNYVKTNIYSVCIYNIYLISNFGALMKQIFHNLQVFQQSTQNKKQQQMAAEKLEEQRLIEQQYNIHRELMKKISTSGKAFQKISKCYFEIKSQILIICEALSSDIFKGICANSAKNLLENICQMNSSIADHSYQFSSQFQNVINMYSEITKQKLERYKEQRQNFNHYAEKIEVLSRVSDKDRYQRNKEKLRAAETTYEKISNEYLIYLSKINEEAQKIWEKSFIGFSSIFVTKSSQMVHKIKEYMDSFQDQPEDFIVIEDDFDIGLSPATSYNENAQFQMLNDQIHKFLTKDKTTEKIILSSDLFKTKEQQKQNKMKKEENWSSAVQKNTKLTMSMNTDFFSARNNQNFNESGSQSSNINVLKLFGVGSVRPEPVSFANVISQNNSIAKNKVNYYSSNLGGSQKSQLLQVPEKNSFSVFDNIYCQKSKSPMQKPRDKTPAPLKPIFTPLVHELNHNNRKSKDKYFSNNVQDRMAELKKLDQNKKKQEISLLDL